MAVTYVCPTCAARMSVGNPVDNLRCPACRVTMLLQDDKAGAAAVRIEPLAPLAPPFKGLRVARAVRAFGDQDAAPAAPQPGRAASAEETQSTIVPSAPGGSLAQEMEKMVLTARRQVEKEAELVLQSARFKAQQEGEAYRRQLEEALQGEVDSLRAAQQAQATQEAGAIVEQARRAAQKEADVLLAAARRQGEDTVAEARKAVIVEVQRLAQEARAKADEIRAKAQEEADTARARALADTERAKAEAARLLDDTRRTLIEEAKAAAAAVLDRAQQEADALRRKAMEQAEQIRLKAEELQRTAAAELDRLRSQVAAAPAGPVLPDGVDATGGAAAAAATTLPAHASEPAGLDDLQRKVRDLEKDGERSRLVFEKRLKADADAKESAFRDASEAHRVQFQVSILLRVVGPLLLFYGLLVVTRSEGTTQILAGILLAISFGLSLWGLALSRRLKQYVDGLFEYVFREKLKAARAGADGAGGAAGAEGRTTVVAHKKGAGATPVTALRRFGKVQANGKSRGSDTAATPAVAVTPAPASAVASASPSLAATSSAGGTAAVGEGQAASAAVTPVARPPSATPG